ncbi:hypothetical protein [Novosphingobium panipatense]|uniref:hypothetical protein n=1 Tax=Novosphingobium panipatense TaxID=428991 RepID=UPI0036197B2F
MIERRRLLTSATAGAALLAGGRVFAQMAAQGETAEGATNPALKAFMDGYFNAEVDASPETATGLGLDEGPAPH